MKTEKIGQSLLKEKIRVAFRNFKSGDELTFLALEEEFESLGIKIDDASLSKIAEALTEILLRPKCGWKFKCKAGPSLHLVRN